MIKTILFDFDGTLADTAPDMVRALNDFLAARGQPPVPYDDARNLCSGGVRALLGIRGLQGEDFEAARADYLRLYEATNYKDTVLFTGVPEMLTSLIASGYQWGIVTNKPRQYFEPIAARLKLAEQGAAVLVCGDDVSTPKPDPMSLLAAAEHCNSAAQHCIYVGDDERDAQAAAAANMKFITVAWGYWQPNDWQAPVSAIISHPILLPPAIHSIAP